MAITTFTGAVTGIAIAVLVAIVAMLLIVTTVDATPAPPVPGRTPVGCVMFCIS
jgi:hypothetical protein